MRRAALSLVALLVAGCADPTPEPDAAQIRSDLITPGVWVVNGSPDHVLIWVHNEMARSVKVQWRFEFSDGTELPSEWGLSAADAEATLQPNGTKRSLGRGQYAYDDWSWTLLTIRPNETVPPGDHNVVLDTGASRHPFQLRIVDNLTRVSQPGDRIAVRYDGRFHDTGQRFDQGSFETDLGSGETVPGFDYGLMGLAANEAAALIIPPPMGYGYDNTHRDYIKFNGRTLRFDVQLLRFVP